MATQSNQKSPLRLAAEQAVLVDLRIIAKKHGKIVLNLDETQVAELTDLELETLERKLSDLARTPPI